ncbi:carbohydrate ABC transporter permease [Paenibacillus sp. L3-i20]|uniref:carbohydrate ABC transporter permease n=1 Tax=Paenibacillus sp. L3-i20 TaxID=2905833 RepID=UPI001EDCC9AC|nr:carbohydrate ABC transporter permease [Paenibacillus sp. L3-i20]GKU76507.1 sugar ABC transporter permease [Paenibacillus sp. L3-i20]
MNYANVKKGINYILLIALSGLMVFPYLWMFIMSIKPKDELYSGKIWPSTFHFENYLRVFTETNMLQYLWNSIYVSVIIIVLQIVSAIFAAYVFAAIPKKWVQFIFVIILATYMLPAAVTYIPSFILISDWDLLDTHIGYIFSESISIFAIFFLRQTFVQVPNDVVQAAKLDGAGHLRLIFTVYIPYSKNAIASLILITFIYSYNNYMWPSLLIKSEENMFVTIGLRRMFMSQAGYGMDFPLAMAACAVSLLPMFILLAVSNKRIIQSMSSLYVNK